MTDLLRNAVRVAIRNNCPRWKVSVPHWAKTYPNTTEDDVRRVWAEGLTKIPPSFECQAWGEK